MSVGNQFIIKNVPVKREPMGIIVSKIICWCVCWTWKSSFKVGLHKMPSKQSVLISSIYLPLKMPKDLSSLFSKIRFEEGRWSSSQVYFGSFWFTSKDDRCCRIRLRAIPIRHDEARWNLSCTKINLVIRLKLTKLNNRMLNLNESKWQNLLLMQLPTSHHPQSTKNISQMHSNYFDLII